MNEFIGKLWVHLPRAAQVLQKLRSPLLLTVFSLLIAAGVFTSFSGENAKQRPGSKPGWKIRKKQPPAPLKDGMEGILFVLTALAFASGLLALISFTRPPTVAEEREIPYEMRGEFQYSAPSPPGIYDGEQIQSGDPIYLRLTDQFDVSFQFQFISEQLSHTGGMIRLEAEISDTGGWRRRIELLHSGLDVRVVGVDLRGERGELTGVSRDHRLEFDLVVLHPRHLVAAAGCHDQKGCQGKEKRL